MSQHHNTLIEVLGASHAWIAHFNAGRVDDCVETYLPEATMDAAPVGRFSGREAIDGFWRPFIAAGAGELVYSNVRVRTEGEDRARLSADWRMNVGRGVIYNELWVRGEDNRWRLAEDHFEVQERFDV